ncbi:MULTISPECIES: alcohol dehydrogenase catalytic domain-containing protein [Amycolatopsis]|uniref:NAD(P)-dependent alcohol dehydrogenase n=1 Tax=Amycolatopsis tucumanensis TaxID=401106 RepID=A0ABP7HX51_9PSEU|nr:MULTISPECIES: alcohol dehydrogenase catalytic domain-containing protein [Amycolatopsis]MCF6421357.1 alcohol dehydrogenase catalytic domain-containing protein [Amycolatopsis tucumanensis]
MSRSLAAAQAPWPVVGDGEAGLPERMRVMSFDHFGDPDVLQMHEVDTPQPGPGEVAVRVAAVSVGRLLDLSARAGTHPYARITLPHILGAEHAGTVAAVGAGVDSVRPGDLVAVVPILTCGTCAACADGALEACASTRIMGVHTRGAYAEYTVVPAANALVVPAGVGPVEATALVWSGAVAENQFEHAGLKPGEWVLVHGASSALGSLTAALAVHHGARVIAGSRSAAKRERLAGELKAEAVVDPTDPTFGEQVRALTGSAGVDLVIDNLGDPAIWSATMDVLAMRGRVVTSGAFLGGKVELDLLRLYSRSQRVIGVRSGNLRSARRVWSAVEAGFRPVIDRTFPIAEAASAHRYLEASANTGRVVLTTADDDWAAAPETRRNSS